MKDKQRFLLYIEQKLNLLLKNQRFIESILYIRDKFSISVTNFPSKVPIQHTQLMHSQFKRYLDEILTTFNLPDYYRDFITQHIKTAILPKDYIEVSKHELMTINESFSNTPVTITDGFDNIRIFSKRGTTGKVKRLFIEIASDTTTKDLLSAWEKIEAIQKEMPGYNSGRRKVSKNDKRDFRIYELAETGLTARKIATLIHSEFGGSKLGYEEVHKILSRFKKKLSSLDKKEKT